MEIKTYIEFVRRESAALADAAATVSLDTDVPTCPGWTMGILVAHLGHAQQWARKIVDTRAQERVPFEKLEPAPEGEALIPWFREQTTGLLATLEATDPATPVWNMTHQRNAGFWSRRQAHEAAVHRWDAQNATGQPQPIDAELAVDGVEELLEVLPVLDKECFVGGGESIHFHATDAAGEWMIRLGPEGLEVSHEHAKAEAAARGTASNIDLFVWGRVSLSAFEVFGDAALLTRFQSLTAR